MSIESMILSGSCLTIVTLILRKLLLHRLPKDTFVVMWSIAALRMLIPWSLPFRYSILTLLPSRAASVEYPIMRAASEAGAKTGNVLRVSTKTDVAAIIWTIGALIFGIIFIAAWLRGHMKFKQSISIDFKEMAELMKKQPLKRSVRLMKCTGISSPLTYGILHPVILLPDRAIVADDLRLILAHEWQHICRLDGLKKALFVIAACVHWYNPLVWIMLFAANNDIELACDEAVLYRYGERKAYAMMLISMEEQRCGQPSVFSCLANNQTEERIKAIMKMRSKSILSVLLSALLVLTTCSAFAITSVSDLKEKEEFEQYESFGLTYNAEDGRLYFKGKLVRYFEDMYPVGNDGDKAGSVFSCTDGEVDVHAIRDLTGDIVRNADGSFDPSGKLIGVEPYPQEEFDARTVEIDEYYGNYMMSEGSVTSTVAEDGTVEYVQSNPVYAAYSWEDGPTSVYVNTEEDGYSYSLNEGDVVYETEDTISIIGGADEATSIFVSDQYELADNGKIYPAMFAEYEAFGLKVEDNKLFFNGQHVRSFKDTYKVDFFKTISCEHTDDDGVIDVVSVRDGTVLKELRIVE